MGHFVAAMNDFDVSKDFYLNVMGMRISDYIERERPDGRPARIAFFHCNPRHHSLGFSTAAPAEKRLRHIMIEVGELDDLGMTYDLARERGIADTTIGRHPNDRQVSFYLRTPSGWLIEYGWGARPVDDSSLQIEKFNTISLWGHKRDDGSSFGEPPRARQGAAAGR
jgi:2,3-dihydroxybiphenyl 1,2-dioxygenase